MSALDKDYPRRLRCTKTQDLAKTVHNLLHLNQCSLMTESTPRFGFVAFAETWNGRLAMLGF